MIHNKFILVKEKHYQPSLKFSMILKTDPLKNFLDCLDLLITGL
jgi:hypothetical protein